MTNLEIAAIIIIVVKFIAVQHLLNWAIRSLWNSGHKSEDGLAVLPIIGLILTGWIFIYFIFWLIRTY